MELDRRLKQLHDQLIVVSSTAREEPTEAEDGDSGTYGWLWRSIRYLMVGSRSKAVQHAKLWLLHWGAADAGGEYLEIVASSSNLTRAAFKGQLQAAWRACIELHPKRSDARLKNWGVLPQFLRELAASTAEDSRLDPFVELLARGDCPDGVRFFASVPGTHSRQDLRNMPWGAPGLREIIPPGRGVVSVAISCPFVGAWTADALRWWCARFESSPDRLELVWIDKDHPWARSWLLPQATLTALAELDATLLKLCYEPGDSDETDGFHHEHHAAADERWSHAKVYSFKRGNSRRLLVTSANFSPAAWGMLNDKGELIIENFELGVSIEQADWPFADLEVLSNRKAATVPNLANRGSAFITWVRAVWDGKIVNVRCRCAAGRELAGAVHAGSEWNTVASWSVDGDGWLRSAKVPWTDAKRPPLLVRLTCEQESVSVPVFDERSSQNREKTLPPEVDESAAQAMRDELLFEQYGGCVAAEVVGGQSFDGDNMGQEDDEVDGPALTDSYSVPAFALARRYLAIVDTWADHVRHITARDASALERDWLRRDGELLIEAFERQSDRDGKKELAWALGAKLAAEELALRLKHFREA
jgi:hypothetical protein